MLLCAAVFAMHLHPLHCYDFWQHLASGRLVAENGWPADSDVFSHTAQGRPWTQFWLVPLLLHHGYAKFGMPLLIVLKALVAAATFFLVAQACLKRGVGAAPATVAAAEAAFVASVRSYLRPEILSFLIFAAFVLVTEAGRTPRRSGEQGMPVAPGKRNWRALWLLPVLMALWVNVHGAFVGGLIYLGCIAAGETLKWRLRRPRQSQPQVPALWAVLAACAAATLVNPYGWAIWRVPFALSRNRAVGELILEWKPLELAYFAFNPRFWVLHLLLASLFITARRIDLGDLVLLGVFGFLAATARRHLLVFCLVCAPVLAKHFSLALGWAGRGPLRVLRSGVTTAAPWLAGALSLLMAWFALGIPCLQRCGLGVRWELYPVGAADFLETHDLTGNLFNTYDFGNYLLWRLYPRNLVFVDGRADVYGEALLREYDRVRSGKQGWEECLLARGVRLAVLRSKPHELATDEPLLNRLFRAPAWRLVFWNQVAAVFVRDPRENLARLADGTEFRFLVENLAATRVRSEAEWRKVTAHLEGKQAAGCSSASLHANLGLCYQMRGDFAKAAEQFRRLTALKPNDATAHALLAEALFRMAQEGAPGNALFAQAENAFLHTLKLNPRKKKALHNLGDLYYLTGRYRPAIKMYSRAFRLAPTDWRLPWAMSFCCAKLGDLAAGRSHLRTVLKLNPKNQDARRRLSEMMNAE